MMLTDDELKELRRKHKAAKSLVNRSMLEGEVTDGQVQANADFWDAVMDKLPILIDEVEHRRRPVQATRLRFRGDD